MGAGHAHALFIHEHSAVHHLAPQVKLVATATFVAVVALTPREAVLAFAAHGLVLGVVAAVARVPARFMATRLTAVLPFVLFAFLIPFVAAGEKVEVIGVSLSVEGLWGAWNIIAKATIGASSVIILAATTEVPDILSGMARLRAPVVLTSIAGFMIRYLEVIANELSRMRTAMAARGYNPRWIWQAKPIATSAGALFIRSYERGERVHAAMLSRGYTGTMPDVRSTRALPSEWFKALTVPALGLAVLIIAAVYL